MRPETLHQVVLAAILAGLGLSLYAGYETVNTAAASACSPSAVFSCSAVLHSGKTTILGVQDWIIGAAGFVALLVIDVPLYRSWRRPWLAALLGLSAIGVAVSAYLGSIEVTQIGALCPVCLSAYGANLVVLVGAGTLWRRSSTETSAVSDRVDDAASGPTGSA